MTSRHAPSAVTSMGKCRWRGGKRELGIELRNQHFREPALYYGGIGERKQTAMARIAFSRRSRRPHASVETLCTRTGIARRAPVDVAGRQGKVCGRTPCMHASGKSDVGNSTKEAIEQRRPADGGDGGGEVPMTKRNPEQTAGGRAQNRKASLTGLGRIREAARKDRRQRFTSLMHHITPELLRASYMDLKRDAATGVDELTWREYGTGLGQRLADLHERVQSGQYKAQPSKRIFIPKEDGRERPIGIAALDMVLQGYFNYFAVPGTAERLGVFRKQEGRIWLNALRRRSHKAQKTNLETDGKAH